jgi:hypothetical protein
MLMLKKKQIPNDMPHNHTYQTRQIFHIRYASMNDALSDMLSVRTSVFSMRTSITTKTSHTSINTADVQCSRLVDALDLESYNESTFCTITLRESSLAHIGRLDSALSSTGNSIGGLYDRHDDPSMLDAEFEELTTATAPPSAYSASHVAVHLPVPAAPTHEYVEGPNFAVIAEYGAQKKVSRDRHWISKLKRQVTKVPRKAHGLARSTRHFSRIFLRYIKTTRSARNYLGTV